MKQRDIFWFWLPLFASWLLMTAEGPIISAFINRLPDEVVMLAAQGIVMTVSVTIQSPIINLLATSTALVKDRASFLIVRRFTFVMMGLLTAVTILIAYTPLFDIVIINWLGTPLEVANWVRPGMRIMTLWSAAIAWRRFLQGALIHFGQTNKVGWGTAVRLSMTTFVLVALTAFTNLPGIIIGSAALISAVVAEALYATWATRPLFRGPLGADAPAANAKPLTMLALIKFHLPLAGTAVLILLVQPLVTFTLARLDNPTLSLAAWPVLFQITLLARAAALAFPETVIALLDREGSQKPIRRFVINVALATSVLMVLFTFTPAARFYLLGVQDTTVEVGQLVLQTLPFLVVFPALTAVNFWLRGILIYHRVTTIVNVGMAVNIGITAIILFTGLNMRLPGLPTAAAALNVAMVCEIFILAWRANQLADKPISLGRLAAKGGD